MPENRIQSRKSIHRQTPRREESDQADGLTLETTENSIDTSETDEEYEDKNKTFKTTRQELPRKLSSPPRPKSPAYNKKLDLETSSLRKFPYKNCGCHLTILLLLAAIPTYYLLPQKQQSCSFESLQNEYPKEIARMWADLQFGIEMVLNKGIEKPAVYLLAHYGTQKSIGLVQKIAQKSSKCFGKELVIMQKEFLSDSGSLDDYGYAIKKYKNMIEEGNVFLIANLNKIPARAARALHTICDTHSPIQKHVAIFLSLIIKENKEGNAHYIAEETLLELWDSELDRHELDPLITRVTDQVIILKS